MRQVRLGRTGEDYPGEAGKEMTMTLSRSEMPEVAGTVSVDTGSVQFVFDGEMDSEAAFELWERTYRLSCQTARSGFNGRRGFVNTPCGDGLYPVRVWRYESRIGRELPDMDAFYGQLPVPEGARVMTVGDCGIAQFEIAVNGAAVAHFWWVDVDDEEELWIDLTTAPQRL